jgi:hypothetical protein
MGTASWIACPLSPADELKGCPEPGMLESLGSAHILRGALERLGLRRPIGIVQPMRVESLHQ